MDLGIVAGPNEGLFSPLFPFTYLKGFFKYSAKKEVLILSPVPITVSNQEVKAPGRKKL